MKQIILDHLWRKSRIIASLLLIELVAVRPFGTTAHCDIPWLALLLSIYLGPSLLSSDQRRGLTRALMALPVTAKQIGRAWWLSTVGVPALLLTATTGLSAIVPVEGGRTGLLFLNCLMQILFLGSLFGLSSLMVAGDQGGWHERTRRGFWRGFFGTIWRLAIAAGILLLLLDFSWSDPFRAGILVAAGSVLTITGWFLAERMVWRRGAYRPNAQATASRLAQYKAPAGCGGLPFLWQGLLIPLGWLGLAFVGWLVLAGMFQGRSLRFPPQLVEVNVILFSPISFLFVYAFVVVPVVTQLRFLRTLPISASIFAATLVLIPSGSIIFFGFVFAALGGGDLVLGSLLTAAAAAVFVPLFVWRGLGTVTFLPVVLLVIMGAITFPILFMFFELTDGPPIWTVPFSIIVIAISWEITRRVLRSSSKAYRVDPLVTSDWGGGMRWS